MAQRKASQHPQTVMLSYMHDLMTDLHTYNDWANQKVFEQCDGLSDKQLDTERDMGFGTLRRTLFHLLSAESVWMERWQGLPWRALKIEPDGASTSEIFEQLKQVGRDRLTFLRGKSDDDLCACVSYEDSRQQGHEHRLVDLVTHVFNHGIHHRAQALNYLKQFDRTVPVGIDYIFFRIASGSSPQSPDAAAMMNTAGLTIDETGKNEVAWNPAMIVRYFGYHDWANACVLSWAAELNSDQLTEVHDIGHGDIQTTLLHLYDVERWWLASLMGQESQFGQKSRFASVDELSGNWMGLRKTRDQFIASITDETANELVELNFGGPTFRFQVFEGVTQIACHATHHRAQLINMLRHSDCDVNNIDLLYALSALPNPA